MSREGPARAGPSPFLARSYSSVLSSGVRECTACRLNADLEALPPSELAYVSEDWRLAHAWSSLPGYMILQPLRHAVALDELTPREAAVLGPLLAATTCALRAVVGCP